MPTRWRSLDGRASPSPSPWRIRRAPGCPRRCRVALRAGAAFSSTSPASPRRWRATSPLSSPEVFTSGARPAVRSLPPHSSGRSGRGALRLRRGLSERFSGSRAAPAAAAAACLHRRDPARGPVGGRLRGPGRSGWLLPSPARLAGPRAAGEARPLSPLSRSSGRASVSSRRACASCCRRPRPRRVVCAPRPAAGPRRPRRGGPGRTSGAGSPPHVTGRLRAERLWIRAQARAPFRRRCFSSWQESVSPERVADRGDRIVAVGHLIPEDLPASTRDIPMPWPQYRLSIKSPMLIERRAAGR